MPSALVEGVPLAASVRLLATVWVVLSSSLSPPPSPCPQYGNLVVIAGLIDTHVHLNVPGTCSEGVGSGMFAAAADGMTTVLGMPLNSAPATISLVTLRSDIAAFVADPPAVDVGFINGAVGSGGRRAAPAWSSPAACGRSNPSPSTRSRQISRTCPWRRCAR